MKFKYYILFVCALLCITTQAQTLEECIDKADKLYAEGDYIKSIEYYKRAAYFDTSTKHSDKVYKQIGNALFQLKNYDEAVSNYDKSYYFWVDSIQKNDCIIAITRSLFASAKYLEGISEIQNLTFNLNDSQFRQKHFYLGLNYFFVGSMDSSEEHYYKGGAAKAYIIAGKRKTNLKKKKMAQIISLLK
ncbi:MAG: tetratricopeptide repeat protein [Bacteroidetes bacterium]|nr:tetratricopeptide repeat protein [Bacteroidota bacterium]